MLSDTGARKTDVVDAAIVGPGGPGGAAAAALAERGPSATGRETPDANPRGVAPRIACLGEALVVLNPTAFGPLEHVASFSRAVGGAEVNVAIGLAERGIPTALLTRVGDDGFGRYLISQLAGHGVDVRAIAVDESRATGLYVKEIGGDSHEPTDLGRGKSRMHYFRSGSAGSAFSASDLAAEPTSTILGEAGLIHTTGITAALSPSAQTMVESLLSRERGSRLVSFDVNWRPVLWRGREEHGIHTLRNLAELSDIVFLGASEAIVLFGTSDPDSVRRLLPSPRWLVVKNDGNAATGFDGTRRMDVPALTVNVVEAIGAGDAFAAGFLRSLLDGYPLEECLRAGHESAGIALTSTDDHVGRARHPGAPGPR